MSRRRLAIVGAGIVGLAHALAGARRGYAVTVFERDEYAAGASVRNFGLGLLVGQPLGELFELAQQSRSMWLEIWNATGCWHKAQGSLTVARDEVELAVLEAFQQELGRCYASRLLSQAQVREYGVAGCGALYSPHEIALESRRAMPALAAWLAAEYRVEFRYGVQVNHIELPHLYTSIGVVEADRVVVCAGHDVQTLYPEQFAPLGVRRCALQMLRVANPGMSLGPALMTGLSTLHYGAYSQSPVLAAPLAKLREHVQQNEPALLAHGIHLIIQQVGEAGELIIGDSHEYGQTVSPFNLAKVDELLLDLAQVLLQRPLQVLERWQGIYASGPRSYEILQPADGVQCVAMTAGIGMSIALGLAERNLSS